MEIDQPTVRGLLARIAMSRRCEVQSMVIGVDVAEALLSAFLATQQPAK